MWLQLIPIQTFVPFRRSVSQAKIWTASGQRESATNRLGEHGGVGFGPMRHECKVLHEPPDVLGGVFVDLMPTLHGDRHEEPFQEVSSRANCPHESPHKTKPESLSPDVASDG
jgi:hypothetical protein